MGPLGGVRVVEMAGIGPAPFCAMVLGDMGAEAIRVERDSAQRDECSPTDPLLRNRRSIALNLKIGAGVEALLALVETADVFIEGYRPGVK
jgi:alpha-methylacyl-CoA racemase